MIDQVHESVVLFQITDQQTFREYLRGGHVRESKTGHASLQVLCY